jgi:hypothetical protein
MIRIPDIIDDCRACDLLARDTDILATVPAGDQAAQIHVNAYHMAIRMLDIARARRADLVNRMLEDTDDGIEALGDINRAEQLAAHHLDMLDRLGGRPATLTDS